NRGPSTRRMTASQDQKRFFPDSGLRRLTLLFTHPVAKYATRVGHPGAQEDIFGTQRTLLDYVAARLLERPDESQVPAADGVDCRVSRNFRVDPVRDGCGRHGCALSH